jgi:hypothetical protein
MFCGGYMGRRSHSFKYSIDIYNELLDFNEKNYSNFSKLLKMTFQEAVYKFEDKSIDLLHIDGYHTYEAVKVILIHGCLN